MGGDADPAAVNSLMHHIRNNHKRLHTAWYSGRSLLSPAADLNNFDYIKLGPYLKHLGALRNRNTSLLAQALNRYKKKFANSLKKCIFVIWFIASCVH